MTQVASKKTFLDWLSREIKDDQVIILTNDFGGELSVSAKRNCKKVSFAFAADAFADQKGIGHFMLGKTPAFAFAVCDESQLSEATLGKVKSEK